MSDVTRILSQIEQGNPQAAEKLLPLVYDELRKLAAAKLAQEKPGQTLQATALVHEAYIRLVGGGDKEPRTEEPKNQVGVEGRESVKWNSRGHFFGAAAEAMRRILVEQARSKHSSKRGGDRQRCDLVDMTVCPNPRIDDLLDLPSALGPTLAPGCAARRASTTIKTAELAATCGNSSFFGPRVGPISHCMVFALHSADVKALHALMECCHDGTCFNRAFDIS
jgi:hypothetical protein